MGTPKMTDPSSNSKVPVVELHPKSSGEQAEANAGREHKSHKLVVGNTLNRYGIHRWGSNFLQINEVGHLCFQAPNCPLVDLQKLSEELGRRGIRTPYILRFPTMITNQMRMLKEAFAKASKENNYSGEHIGVYPLKVNQRRSVVDTVIKAREQFRYGLEAGSKPELLLAMAQPVISDLPLICNGYKDREFIRMAFHAAELGHRVIIVIESTREVQRYLDVFSEQEWRVCPELGVRAKLYSRGSGRWQSSGGEKAKFGLTTNEILAVVHELKRFSLQDSLTLMHFHIGSQITQIKRIKQAVREGARLYATLKSHCPQLSYIDLGGGIGVDYDGSRTSYPSSANYTLDEYASQVVFEISEVCAETQVSEPCIITESGRVLVANHAVTIADLREVQGEILPMPEPVEDEHRLISELRYTLEHINAKNIEEYFHDAIDYRDECLQLFSSGYLSLEDRASAEGLFQRIRNRCAKIVEGITAPPEEIVDYLNRAQHKYLANFSIFQSLPDTWSIQQVFPAAPLARHLEPPTLQATIVDITCDSDGCVNSFAHPDENMQNLPLHVRKQPDEQYYLGFFMTGAYQDSLANTHNLFARCHEVVLRDPDEDKVLTNSERIELADNLTFEVKLGYTNKDVLEVMDFDGENVTKLLRDRHLNIETSLDESWAMGLLQSYPYLAR